MRKALGVDLPRISPVRTACCRPTDELTVDCFLFRKCGIVHSVVWHWCRTVWMLPRRATSVGCMLPGESAVREATLLALY